MGVSILDTKVPSAYYAGMVGEKVKGKKRGSLLARQFGAYGRGRRQRRIYLREWREFLSKRATVGKGPRVTVSVPKLAAALGITRTSYYRLEKAPHTLSAGEMVILAQMFRIEPEQLWNSPNFYLNR